MLRSVEECQSGVRAEDLKNGAVVEFRPSKQLYLAFFPLATLAFAAALVSTTYSLAAANIASSIGMSSTETLWAAVVAVLASTVIQPIGPILCDGLGRLVSFGFSAAVLAVGSLLGALAHSPLMLIFGRCLQGLGSGTAIVVTEIMVTEMVPLHARGYWFALLSVAWAVGSITGPLIGGILAGISPESWRWIFWMIIPICIVATAAAAVLVKPSVPRKPLRLQLRHTDFIGFFIFAASLTAVLVPILQARMVYPWLDYRTLIPLCLGSTGLICFSIFELRLARHALIPISKFDQLCTLGFFAALLHGLVLWCMLYYLPVYYETVKGLSTAMVGVALLPETLTIVPASIVAGILVSSLRTYREAIQIGWILTTLGTGLLLMLEVNTKTAVWAGLNLILGVGTGILFGAMAFTVQASSDRELLPVAVSLFSFFRSLGSVFGIAIGGTIFQNHFDDEVSRNPNAVLFHGQNSFTAGSQISSLPLGDTKQWALQVVADSLHPIWLFCCIVSAVGLGSSLLLKKHTLQDPHSDAEAPTVPAALVATQTTDSEDENSAVQRTSPRIAAPELPCGMLRHNQSLRSNISTQSADSLILPILEFDRVQLFPHFGRLHFDQYGGEMAAACHTEEKLNGSVKSIRI